MKGWSERNRRGAEYFIRRKNLGKVLPKKTVRVRRTRQTIRTMTAILMGGRRKKESVITGTTTTADMTTETVDMITVIADTIISMAIMIVVSMTVTSTRTRKETRENRRAEGVRRTRLRRIEESSVLS